MCACQKSYTSIIITSITWAGPRCVQGLGAFLGPENRTQRRSVYHSVTFIYFISKLSCCPYIVYFEALLITTYLVLEIQLHTLLADLRDGLLLRQAAADELQRDEHLQLSFSLWSSFLTSTLLLPVIMQYQFYDLNDKCSWVLPRLIHFLNIDIKIDTQYPKKTHK